MPAKEKDERTTSAEQLGKLLKAFGDTVSEIMEDPKLREKAKEFSASVVDSAAKVASRKIKDAEVRTKFTDVGKAAQTFGKKVVEEFGTSKEKPSPRTKA